MISQSTHRKGVLYVRSHHESVRGDLRFVRGSRMGQTHGRPENGRGIGRGGSPRRRGRDHRDLRDLPDHQAHGQSRLARLVAVVLAVALVVAIGAGVTASPARAYLGQAFVETGTTLTDPAKTILTNPTFLTQEPPLKFYEGGGGPPKLPWDGGGWWERPGWSSGLLPAAAAVIGFGAGTVIGSKICNDVLSLEGCWFFSNDSPDPIPSGGEWEYHANVILPWVPAFSYVWNQEAFHLGIQPYGSECGFPMPAGTTTMFSPETTKCFGVDVPLGNPVRSPMQNRTLSDVALPGVEYSPYTGSGYCPTVGPGSTECLSEPPENWAERFRTCLDEPEKCGLTEEQRDQIGQKIASEIPETGISNPFALTVEVPDCSGLLRSECVDLVEELELVPDVEELDWKTAHLFDLDPVHPYESVEESDNRVVEVTPPAGNIVETETELKITVNPAFKDMPVVVPAREDQESYDEYVQRISEHNSQLKTSRTTVTEANTDTSTGPDGVIRTNPQFGSRQPPDTDTDLEVLTNPHDAPLVVVGGGSCDASVDGLNFSPLIMEYGEKFPFGIFFFVQELLDTWTPEPRAPVWHLTIIPEGVFGFNDDLDITFNSNKAATVVEAVRTPLIFLSFVAWLWFLATALLRMRGDDGEQ